MPAPFAAQRLGHYRIAEKIGAGGMGEVYRAHDEHLERDAALKLLPSGALADDAARSRFRKEALALSRLNHPNIETVFDFDTSEGVDYLATEYIAGSSLDEVLAGGSLPEEDIVRLGAQLADGLAAAHAQGIIHRDLKPANLRVTGDGRLKILDFGLAKLVQPIPFEAATENISESMRFAGTLPYMAPEQIRGRKLDSRTDLWAAGVVLYEMATGHRPFGAAGLQVADQILNQAAPPPSAVSGKHSPALDAIILKCLDKDPEQRYQSAKELAVDLRRLTIRVAERGQTGAPLAGAAAHSARRTWMFAAAMLLLVAGLTSVSSFVINRWRSRGAAPIQSVAVLPFVDLSGDASQDYFADGMTEALITRLSKVRALRVISRTSVLRYKGTTKPIPEIARELNVDAVLEGSMLRQGDRVRITAQLIGANPERHLWANDYDRDFKDILRLHSDVAQAIAREIRVNVTPAEQQSLGQARPVNPEAHDAYLRGRYLGTRFMAEPLRQARQYLQRAVQIDPSYVPAWVELAHVDIKLGGNIQRDPGLLADSKSAALKALELDPNNASAHMLLAIGTAYTDMDIRTIFREAERALELDSNSADVLIHGSIIRLMQRRTDESVAMVDRALELEPLDFEINHLAALMLMGARQFDRAIAQARRALEIDPNSVPTYNVLEAAYEAKKDYPNAVVALEKAATLAHAPAPAIAALRRAYATAGIHGVLLWRLARFDAMVKQGGQDSPFMRAQLYASLGDKERAIQWLERAYQERDAGANLMSMGINFRFEGIRSDPRFQALMTRMGLPQ